MRLPRFLKYVSGGSGLPRKFLRVYRRSALVRFRQWVFERRENMPKRIELPSPGESSGCGDAMPLMLFYMLKALFLVMLGKHPAQRGQ